MAALNFPANPTDGQLYPDPAQPGVTQYIYNDTKGTWLTVFRGVETVTGVNPILVGGTTNNPAVSIRPSSQTQAGSMSAADKTKLDNLNPSPGTVTDITAGLGLGAPAAGNTITSSGTINLLPPTPTVIGGVRAGTGVATSAQGVLNLQAATTANLGGVKQGAGLSISADGTISLASSGSFVVLDSIASQFNDTRTVFTLAVNGLPYAPATVNNLLIFVGGVLQAPLTNFSVVGSTLTFTGAPPTGASFYGISLT
jgi:hypothetical protein